MQPSLFPQTYTVSQFTERIRVLLEENDDLRGLTVEGEVSNFTRATSGHCYFTLKDAKAAVRCVMWSSTAQRQPMLPKDGDTVEVLGRVTLYAPRGEYQIQVDKLRPTGAGDLYLEFERLKQKLDAEGLFDPARKRPLPVMPKRIGVVTSPTAAAFQDIQNVLRRRYPLAELLLSPALVQGVDAPLQIVGALERLNAHGQVDVILLIRGGGSIEDLWCFNDERVARAVAASRVPVVSGVGHEIDFTIVDFVADVRAPTPSAAAEVATPHIDALRQAVIQAESEARQRLLDSIESRRADVDDLMRTLKMLSPEVHIRTMRQRLDSWDARIESNQRARLALWRERLKGRSAALEAASPQAILARGYAIVRDENGQRVRASAVQHGQRLSVQVADGQFVARVEQENEV